METKRFDKLFPLWKLKPMSNLSISELRADLGLSLEEFGARIGLSSKGGVSKIERGIDPVSLDAALAIEALSIKDGKPRINAASLNDRVARARAACGNCLSHVDANSAGEATGEAGKSGDLTGQGIAA